MPLPGQQSLLPDRMYAEFSDDRVYRYSLIRVWRPDGDRLVNFLLLNPSTADETNDDPTIRRCLGYAEKWEYDGLIVTNLFALRSTDPKALKKSSDPVGPRNNEYILKTACVCNLVVCAWGNHGSYLSRDFLVRTMLRQHHINFGYLSLSKTSQPMHPLYLRGDLEPRSWETKEKLCLQKTVVPSGCPSTS